MDKKPDTKQFPDVAILIITYNRPDEIRMTINALLENIVYPADKLHYVISDDSTGGRYLADLKRNHAYKGMTFISTPQRAGWGKHVNWAMTHIYTQYPDVQYIFQIEDDYVLTRELDMRVGVALLETMPNVGMLRYRGTAGMHAVLHQFEADIHDYLPDYDESAGLIQGKVCYLQLDSGGHGLWIYSNGPHLKRLRGANSFHDFYGGYPETLKLGQTEEWYAHVVKDKMKLPEAPAIAILPSFVTMQFQHIGDTWKDSEQDI